MNNGVMFGAAPWSRSDVSNLAVRGLKKIGKSFRLGLELGVSNARNSVVLSIYLSHRNNQRLIIPIMLFRENPLMDQRVFSSGVGALFWTVFVPSLGFAAIDYFTPTNTAELLNGESKKKDIDARAQARQKSLQGRVSHRRAEADDLVSMLAQPVLHRQLLQRENDGLVIVSAKYGVLADPRTALSPNPIWAASEDVADVTIAVAALVDDKGTLCVPGGLKKSRLLGFWDPKPGRTKWLVVEYVWSGREMTKVVAGRDELRLP